MNYVVFDIETTGLSPQKDRIIEIGAVKVSDGIIVEEFSKLINPQIPIPYEASSVNGITDYTVKDAPYSGQVMLEFQQFIQDTDFLIGHNSNRFDYPFLVEEFRRNSVKHTRMKTKDTLLLARMRVKGLKSYSLKNLCAHFSITNDQAHRALSDAKATQVLFEYIY